MKMSGRVFITALVALASYELAGVIAVTTAGLMFREAVVQGRGMLAATLGSLACALVVAWFTWKKTASIAASNSSGMFASIALGAIIVGAAGFVAGFVAPIIFAPDANQGPLLGIFITGPLGVLTGGIGGFVHWRRRSKQTMIVRRS
jgi:hypothetical protein